MITFFAPVRPFVGLFDILQRNAIASWKRAIPGAQVIILDREEAVGAVCAELGVEWVRDIPYDERFDRPHVGGLFTAAEARATNDILCFVNGDNIMLELLEPIEQVKRRFPRFCLVGERCNLKVEEVLDFDDPQTAIRLKTRMKSEGWWSNENWIDYFIYTKGSFGTVPKFLVGAGKMDNWLIQKAACTGLPLIDCGRSMIDIHQEHEERSFLETKYTMTNVLSPIRAINDREYAAHQVASGGGGLSNMLAAEWLMTPEGFVPNPRSAPFRTRRAVARAFCQIPVANRIAISTEAAWFGFRRQAGGVLQRLGLRRDA
jgi:hypothetical protein